MYFDLKKTLQGLIDAGYRQTEIGRNSGISQSAISLILRGKQSNVRLDKADKLQRYALKALKKRRGK